jgi:flagellin
MRELAVQAANGTETDEDRGNLQDEVSQLQKELDRISTDTEFNTMKLLDGSLDGSQAVTNAGPKFGIYDTSLKGFVTSDISNVKIATSTGATLGGESGLWSADGKTLTLKLHSNTTYTEAELDNLIKNAKQEDSSSSAAPAKVELNLNNGTYTINDGEDSAGVVTVAGKKAYTAAEGTYSDIGAQSYVGVSKLRIEANKYGSDNNISIAVWFDAESGDESFELKTAATYTSTGDISDKGYYELHLATGTEYTEGDLEKLLAQGGFSAKVEFQSPAPDEKNTLFVVQSTDAAKKGASGVQLTLTNGTGLGDTDAFLGQKNYDVKSGGEGVTLQVGANFGQTISFGIGNMSSTALGVDNTKVDVSTQTGAQNSLDMIDEAIGTVSKQRSLLGAIQNRLEHTISNLDNTAENLQSAESSIRDVNMANEMVQYSKNNILTQAATSMLAQANQSNQGVLSLLG